MSYSSVKIRPNDWEFLDAIKEITRFSKAEILSQALENYFNNLPGAQKKAIGNLLKNTMLTGER